MRVWGIRARRVADFLRRGRQIPMAPVRIASAKGHPGLNLSTPSGRIEKMSMGAGAPLCNGCKQNQYRALGAGRILPFSYSPAGSAGFSRGHPSAKTRNGRPVAMKANAVGDAAHIPLREGVRGGCVYGAAR